MMIPRRFGFLTTACLAAASVLPSAEAATVGAFTGGDPNEGLDLQGNFTYAVNVGTPGAAGQVGDANFTADNVAGVQLTAQNEIGGWTTMAFGDTDNDKRLGFVLNSIRWSGAPEVVRLRLAVEKDVEYKLQLLFSEQCCPGRGFNVVIDGKTEVENLLPAVLQAGEGDFTEQRTQVGAVVTQQLKTTSNVLEVVLDGAAATAEEISDHNAIFNGFTLERLTAVTDVDNDGLRDDWEGRLFGGLDAKPGDDPDNDGLTNLEEQTLGTNPLNADSDGDGLTDGSEVKQYHTDPNKRDTDGDSLSDGLEVNTYHTDPTKLDSDGDGISDPQEVSLGSDPADKNDKPLRTSIGVVTGADPGEGLDLDGDFPYALALGAGDGGAVTIRSANFSPLIENEVAGATLLAGNTAANWYAVNYGDSADDQALAAATSSIRWSAAGSAQPDVVLTLENLEVGAEYKLQLLFGEQCCNRGFDVFVDQALAVKDFNPGNVHGGIANGKQEALITHTHFARSSTLVIRLDGANASTTFSDHNAIFNAVTVEKVAAKTDTDGDGLPDAWERLYFGGLTETATGDKDGDGLTNLDEYNLGTNPTKADSDRDGLADGAEKTAGTNPANPDTDTDGLRDGEEVNVYHSDPLKGDGDNDGLPDAAEILTYKTDAAKADTDGDGQNDGAEVIAGTDPLRAQPATKVEKVTIASFTGGDPEDGLDLQGTFVYATSFGTDAAAGKAGDAVFTKDDAAGIRWTTQNVIKNWYAAEFGDTANDDTLERAIQAIRWSAAPNRPKIELAVIPGSTYKLQMLFGEQCCAGRGFDILIDGNLATENFVPADVHGGPNNPAMGAVVSAEITTERDTLVIVLDGPGADLETITDHNATINGLTLEALKLGAVVTATRITQAKVEAAGVSLTFESVAGRRYAIEYREALGTGAWTTINDGIAANAATTTFSDVDAPRRAKGQGYYRVRSL